MTDLARIRFMAEQRLPVTGKDVMALLEIIDQLKAENEILSNQFGQDLRGIIDKIEQGPCNARAA